MTKRIAPKTDINFVRIKEQLWFTVGSELVALALDPMGDCIQYSSTNGDDRQKDGDSVVP